jgi:hypothetical protein
MTKRLANTCDDCFFRRAELCAIPGNAPCPTFRTAKSALGPPRQPKLIARPHLAAAHAAA